MTTRRDVPAVALLGLALGFGLAHVTVPKSMLTAPEWMRPARRADGPDFARIADEAASLQARQEQLLREIELGDHMAARLAAGTLSLADAAGEMEPFLRTRAGFDTVCRHYYHVPNTHLGTARYLIEKVRRLLEDDPSREATVTARLEAEYAALK